MKKINIGSILENRKEILEGIKNSIFKKDNVESIVLERNEICKKCLLYDTNGNNCLVKGTEPCCADCGCSLKLKQRSLSSGCPKDYWKPVLTETEELEHDFLKED